MKYLLPHWDAISTRIRQARHILLLIDYDGTLTPIVEKPESADLSPEVKECLQRLAVIPSVALGIISGRTLTDLAERVGIKGIIYVGNHGLEIQGPGISFVNPVARQASSLMHSLYRDIGDAIADVKGARIDNKELTLTLHYRQVDKAQVDELNDIFYKIVNSPLYSGQISIVPDKKAYELKPLVDWDKGKAIEFIALKLNYECKPLMLFLGDDVTDYNGFRQVNNNGGVSIFVGDIDVKTPATYFLYSPEEVYRFLGVLEDIISSR